MYVGFVISNLFFRSVLIYESPIANNMCVRDIKMPILFPFIGEFQHTGEIVCFGISFHSFIAFLLLLLEEKESGRLKVCNEYLSNNIESETFHFTKLDIFCAGFRKVFVKIFSACG